jgi:ubiquinone/menaquinone biosynthesis C-methylase UbiE
MDRKQHWDQIYTTKAADTVSWFQEHAEHSVRLIHSTGLDKNAAIIDVGGGASKLVDSLVAEGYSDLTVLDLSSSALAVAKQRLGNQAKAIHWIEGDITRVELPLHRFDIWHDRAVFHFLTVAIDRQAYVEQVSRAVRPGGHIIIATFGLEGPEKCSGLPVMHYLPETLHAEFGDEFMLVGHEQEVHHTPSGIIQQFVYCYLQKEN